MIFAVNPLLIKILAVIFTVALILFLLAYLITNKIYSFAFGKRQDSTPLKFFTSDDYEGLNYTPIEFKSTNDNTLRGNIYYYDYPIYKGVLIFAHGLGVGHLQYTHEINHFAKLGFKVVTYDNTGSAKSDGESTGGLPQGIMDLKSCLDFVRSRDDLKNYNKVLCGHSWGGYSTINVLPFVLKEDNVKCAVAMGAPFCSTDALYEMITKESNLLKFTGPFISMIEKNRYGQISKMNTLASLSNVDIDTMLVHGTKDHIISYENNFKFVEDNLKKDNVTFVTAENKRHRPNISDDATAYDELIRNDVDNLKARKAEREEFKKYYDNIDYHKLVEFDDNIMGQIDEYILKHFN